MPLRVLLIDDDATYRRLWRQHVATAFEDAAIDEHVPSIDGRLPAEFVAAAFDAVLLGPNPGGIAGLDWLRDFSHRPLFAPVIWLPAAVDAAAAASAEKLGALGVLAGPKLDHAELVRLLQEGRERRQRRQKDWRNSPAAEKAYQFGTISIRGERCIRQIAVGPLASVFLAESEREGRMVVLKVLRQVPDLAEKATTFDRFLQEYQIIAGIQHRNVVRIYDLGIADDHAYIAMEYFPAGDLRTRLRKGLQAEESLAYLRQMAEALAAIHAVGVLHRDLKPGNVMLRADSTVALIDFGLAKQLALDAEITETGEIFGTPYYMSPEQGHGRDVDVRSDLYSLGIIYWEMLTGKKPYLAPTPMAVIYKHSHAPIPELPEPLTRYQSLINRLIAKEPVDRFQSAGEVIAAIDALAPAEAVAT